MPETRVAVPAEHRGPLMRTALVEPRPTVHTMPVRPGPPAEPRTLACTTHPPAMRGRWPSPQSNRHCDPLYSAQPDHALLARNHWGRRRCGGAIWSMPIGQHGRRGRRAVLPQQGPQQARRKRPRRLGPLFSPGQTHATNQPNRGRLPPCGSIHLHGPYHRPEPGEPPRPKPGRRPPPDAGLLMRTA